MTVTLVTGDKVTVHNGRVSVDPAPGREGVSFHTQDGEQVRVVPADAMALLNAGKLDERLFDVSYLIKEGFADHQTGSVPVLVKGDPARVRPVTAATGARVAREMPRTRMAAVAVDKKTDRSRWWTKLTASAAAARAAGRPGAAALPAGMEKVWLDARMKVALDRSVPQIGAPAAWQAGYDGTGATVAVLDTGVDATHPDLAGKVTAEQNFTTDAAAKDGHGHGTHVASTIAGSGAASDGLRKGVAPGARILNGKVLNNAGSGAISWIVAGMEWAAASGADVVNMSLGGTDTPGIDPLEEAVNRLTATTGTLFVIAAGNNGQPLTVGTPGSADAALTVAAVDDNDALASFSSRGPRVGDYANKPDIAAPGVDIAAARATGTSMGTPVDQHYTRANGTSMAAPHVAGAAAILAQRYPDWTPDRLKAVLMSTTKRVEHTPFEVGTGRVDIHRAITQTVTTDTPSVSFGRILHPHDQAPTTKSVTYRNDGDTDVTLDLSLITGNDKGEPAPESMFQLNTRQLTIPARSNATADITMTPGGAPVGTYHAQITATTPTGATIQTIAGAYHEPESYDLTIDVLDRNGQPIPADARGWLSLMDPDRETTPNNYPLRQPSRLPKGRYIAHLSLFETDQDGVDITHQFANVDIDLSDDRLVTLDLRQTRLVQVDNGDRPAARLHQLDSTFVVKSRRSDGRPNRFTFNEGTFAQNERLYVGSTGESEKVQYGLMYEMEEPLLRVDVDDRGGDFAVDAWYIFNSLEPPKPLLGTHRMRAVHGGAGTPAELATVDPRGNLVILNLPAEQNDVFLERVANIKRAGGRAVLLDRPMGQYASARFDQTELPVFMAAEPQRGRLIELARRGDAKVTTRGITASPYRYNLLFPTANRMPADPHFRVRHRDLAQVQATYKATGAGWLTKQQAWASGYEYFHFWHMHERTTGPVRRTEYYTPGEWSPTIGNYVNTDHRSGVAHYHRGERRTQTYFDGVIGPAISPAPQKLRWEGYPSRAPAWVYRDGNIMTIRTPLFSGSQPGHFGFPHFAMPGYSRLYRNGTLIGQLGYFVTTVATVPAGRATYRLEQSGSTNPSSSPRGAWNTSTNVEASWEFSSDTTETPTALPLMAVRYSPDLDDYNRAQGGRSFTFPVRVEHQENSTTANVTQLNMQYSTDDGATWKPAQLRRDRDGDWQADVVNPKSGSVSLRASAVDSDGNKTTQTIKRAYGITTR